MAIPGHLSSNRLTLPGDVPTQGRFRIEMLQFTKLFGHSIPRLPKTKKLAMHAFAVLFLSIEGIPVLRAPSIRWHPFCLTGRHARPPEQNFLQNCTRISETRPTRSQQRDGCRPSAGRQRPIPWVAEWGGSSASSRCWGRPHHGPASRHWWRTGQGRPSDATAWWY